MNRTGWIYDICPPELEQRCSRLLKGWTAVVLDMGLDRMSWIFLLYCSWYIRPFWNSYSFSASSVSRMRWRYIIWANKSAWYSWVASLKLEICQSKYYYFLYLFLTGWLSRTALIGKNILSLFFFVQQFVCLNNSIKLLFFFKSLSLLLHVLIH